MYTARVARWFTPKLHEITVFLRYLHRYQLVQDFATIHSIVEHGLSQEYLTVERSHFSHLKRSKRFGSQKEQS